MRILYFTGTKCNCKNQPKQPGLFTKKGVKVKR